MWLNTFQAYFVSRCPALPSPDFFFFFLALASSFFFIFTKTVLFFPALFFYFFISFAVVIFLRLLNYVSMGRKSHLLPLEYHE